MAFALSDIDRYLDEAYPNGVPTEDAGPLVAILRERLGADQTLTAVLRLAGAGHLDMSAAAVVPAAADLAEADVRRISGRLAAGGWPLALPVTAQRPVPPGAAPSPDEDESPSDSPLGRIVTWLREGYPTGVPDHDYIPLLALLERRLTRSEVKRVARALRRHHVSPAGPEDIAAAITDLTDVDASEDEIRRVADRLAKKGWPVDFPDPL